MNRIGFSHKHFYVANKILLDIICFFQSLCREQEFLLLPAEQLKEVLRVRKTEYLS